MGLNLVVCLVDDGSPDETPRVMEELRAKHGDWLRTHRTSRNKGKGNAIREGAEKLAGLASFLAFTDCDLYYGLNVIPDRVLPALRAGADVVILDRSWDRQFHAGSTIRRFVSYAFNHVKTVLTGVTVEDSQAGLKGFRTEFLNAVIPVAKINGFAFDVELLSIAQSFRFRVERIPIRRLAKHVPEGSSVTLKNAFRMLWDLSRIARAQYSGAYRTPFFSDRITRQIYEIHDEDKE
jgi:glycosyltransferase involved in cell wall biosynthesis